MSDRLLSSQVDQTMILTISNPDFRNALGPTYMPRVSRHSMQQRPTPTSEVSSSQVKARTFAVAAT